jgi:predicted enzyme related to lactoylglutathione lyase
MFDRAAKLLLAFPQFRVEEVVRTAEHYRDVLGFEIDDYFGDPPVFTHVQRDHVVIQIGRSRHRDSLSRSAGPEGYNAYIWTDDLDALAREFKARGAAIKEGPLNRVYPCRELIVEDCNGLILCFAKRIPASETAPPEEDETE